MYRRPAFGIHTSGTRNRRPSNRSRFCPKSLPLGGRVSAQGSRRRRTSDDRVRQENSVTKRLPGRRLFTRFRLFAAPPERRQIDRQSRSTAPNMLDGTRHCSPKSSSDRMRDTDSRDGQGRVRRNGGRSPEQLPVQFQTPVRSVFQRQVDQPRRTDDRAHMAEKVEARPPVILPEPALADAPERQAAVGQMDDRIVDAGSARRRPVQDPGSASRRSPK